MSVLCVCTCLCGIVCAVLCTNNAHCIFKQVHYPSDPMQPGPIYFLTPRKCAIFGICCESIPRQVSKTEHKKLLPLIF